MSSTPFFESGDFTYTAHVRRLEVRKGSINFSITTRWAGAQDPIGDNSPLDITLGKAELRSPIAVLQSRLHNNG